MSDIFKTLGGKSLSELPQIPTELTASDNSTTEIRVGWKNNNTNVTGTTNLIQVFYDDVWNDDIEVASGATSGATTGATLEQDYNIRVAVKNVDRIYPSIVVTGAVKESPYPLSGLQARWQFEDNLLDTGDGGNGYDLSAFSATLTYNTGLIGKAVEVDGSFAFIRNTDMGSIFTGLNSYTKAGWFKMGVNQVTTLYSTRNGGTYDEIFIENLIVRYNDRNKIAHSNIHTVSLNTWYHLIIIYDGTTSYVYFDNVLKYSGADSTSKTPDGIVLGLILNNAEDLFFDNTYIYNRAITSAERAKLYNGGAGI